MDARGAVYVEFLIAFLPLFVTFLCILQLALLFTLKLHTDHAAVQGARAGAVIFGDRPKSFANEVLKLFPLAVVRDAVTRTALAFSSTVKAPFSHFPNSRSALVTS